MEAQKADRTPQQSGQERRKEQQTSLGENEAGLQTLAAQEDKQGFFAQINSLLKPLKRYIKRRLIIAYANWEIRTPLYTSSDLLDEVILKAYENYDRKPKDLSLEQWLYRLANRVVGEYIQDRKAEGSRRASLERLREKELSTLEELPQLTADVEGEPWLAEDLDDAEWEVRDFTPPAYLPPEDLDRGGRRTELLRILRALGRLPEDERAVAELYLVEGFSKEEVARICNVSPERVEQIAERARREALPQTASQEHRKAS